MTSREKKPGVKPGKTKRSPDFKIMKHPPKPPNLPKDYTFVPKGDVYITGKCKKLTALAQKEIVVASDPSKTQGLFCPADVFESVLKLAKETAPARQKAVAAREQRLREDAQIIMLGLFPSIPSQDLQTILDHGFEKGSGRVGRSSRMSEPSRAVLAVQAHVRHVHTDYEALIRQKKGSSRNQISSKDKESIRNRVLPDCNKILTQWRRRKSKQAAKNALSYQLQRKIPALKGTIIKQSPAKTTLMNLVTRRPSERGSNAFFSKLTSHAPPKPLTRTASVVKRRRDARVKALTKTKAVAALKKMSPTTTPKQRTRSAPIFKIPPLASPPLPKRRLRSS